MKKKIAAFLVLIGLVLALFLPVYAGQTNRTALSTYCIVGFLPSGAPIYKWVKWDCVYEPNKTCTLSTRFCLVLGEGGF